MALNDKNTLALIQSWIDRCEAVAQRPTEILSFDADKTNARILKWADYKKHTVSTIRTDVSLSTGTLAFDLDMDASISRPCCKDKQMCRFCFAVMCRYCIYIKAIIGFVCRIETSRILVCFSGRRGFHFWVLDYTASDAIRELIISKIALAEQYPDMIKVYDAFVKDAKAYMSEDHIRAMCRRIKFDRAVTTRASHKLRMPFSVHPATHNFVLPLSDDFLKSPCCYADLPNRLRHLRVDVTFQRVFETWCKQIVPTF
jgi:DNA primase catalytic subunit